jgi:hypothetical protein
MPPVPEGPALGDPATRQALADYQRGAWVRFVRGVVWLVIFVGIGIAAHLFDGDNNGIIKSIWLTWFGIGGFVCLVGAAAVFRGRRMRARLRRCAWRSWPGRVVVNRSAQRNVVLGGGTEPLLALNVWTLEEPTRLVGAKVLWVAGDPVHQWVVVAIPGPVRFYKGTRGVPWGRAKRARYLADIADFQAGRALMHPLP